MFTTVSAPRADVVPRVLRSPSARLSQLQVTIRRSYKIVKVYKLIAGPSLGPAENKVSLKAGSVSKRLLLWAELFSEYFYHKKHNQTSKSRIARRR